MKNYKILFSLILGVLLVTSCNNSGIKPTVLDNPNAPVLNPPSMKYAGYNKDSAAYVLNLDSMGTAEVFTIKPANYGPQLAVTYSLQIDVSGNNFANAQVVTTSTNDTLVVTIPQLYNSITNPAGINVPVGVQTSFDIRVMATIGSGLMPVYSNTQTIKIDPLAALKPYTMVPAGMLKPYFIIGTADGNWNNSFAGIGVSIIPMSVIPGSFYNATTGAGTYVYTGYFKATRGFKLIRDIGSWGEQWGSSDGHLTPSHNNGGSQNFFVPNDGYYTITLNSVTNSLSIVPASVAPTQSYTSMGLIGEFNGWGGDVAMSPSEPTYGTNNHVWYTTYTFANNFTPPVGNGGCKFRANGGWTYNWGAGTFPVGLGTNGGTNIPFLKGSYTIVMNDVDGCFYFFSAQ